jgi:hypothetical protein
MTSRWGRLLLIGLVCVSWTSSRERLQGADAAKAADGKPALTRTKARAAFDRYLEAAAGVMPLAPSSAHRGCLTEYFCGSGDLENDAIRSDAACAQKLGRLEKASVQAFGPDRSRWGGDVFDWVRYGDSGERSDEEVRLARMHVVDEDTVEQFAKFWSKHKGNPAAIALIRRYSAERWASCCHDEKTYFFWAERMEPAFEKAARSRPSWTRLTVDCNGDRDDARRRAGMDEDASERK